MDWAFGRGGTVVWPPRSPDITPLDFYLWGYMRQKVYAVVIGSREQYCWSVLTSQQKKYDKIPLKY